MHALVAFKLHVVKLYNAIEIEMCCSEVMRELCLNILCLSVCLSAPLSNANFLCVHLDGERSQTGDIYTV